MKKCLLLLISIVIFIFMNTATKGQDDYLPQKSRYEGVDLGKRFIKLGETWRKAGEIETAKKYLSKGYNIVKSYNNQYWIAVYYENMGFISIDENQLDAAIFYLKKAKALYDLHGRTRDNDGSNMAIRAIIKKLECESYNKENKMIDENNRLRKENAKLLAENNELLKIIEGLKKDINEIKSKLSELTSADNKAIAGLDITPEPSINTSSTIETESIPQNTSGGYWPGGSIQQENIGTNKKGSFIFMTGYGTMYSLEARYRMKSWEIGLFYGYQEFFQSMYGLIISLREPIGKNWDVCTDISFGSSDYGTVIDANVNFRYFIINNVGLYARVGYNLAYVLGIVNDSYMNLSGGVCVKF